MHTSAQQAWYTILHYILFKASRWRNHLPRSMFSADRQASTKAHAAIGARAHKPQTKQACTRPQRDTASGGCIQVAARLLARVGRPSQSKGLPPSLVGGRQRPVLHNTSPPRTRAEPIVLDATGRPGVGASWLNAPWCVQATPGIKAQPASMPQVAHASMANPLSLDTPRRIHRHAVQG